MTGLTRRRPVPPPQEIRPTRATVKRKGQLFHSTGGEHLFGSCGIPWCGGCLEPGDKGDTIVNRKRCEPAADRYRARVAEGALLPDAYLSGVSFGLAQVADRHLGCPVIMAWSGSQCSCAHPLWEPMKVASGMAGAEGHRMRRTTRPRLLRVATRSMALVISPSGRSMYFRFSRPAASRSHSSVRRWAARLICSAVAC